MSQFDVHKPEATFKLDPSFDIPKWRKELHELKEEWTLAITLNKGDEFEDKVRRFLDRLDGAIKRKLNFSEVTEDDLRKAGVVRRALQRVPENVAELAEAYRINPAIETEIVGLHSRVKDIYGCVNREGPSCSRMVIEAILFSVVEIVSNCSPGQDPKSGVTIFPGMKIPPGGLEDAAVQLSSRRISEGIELWVNGNTDYAVVEYEDIEENKEWTLQSRGYAFEIFKNCMLLTRAKYEDPERPFVSYIPEAISQAIGLLKSEHLSEVRFCLSDGQMWTFFILKLNNEGLKCYQTIVLDLNENHLESDAELRQIVMFLCEWVRPTRKDLFTMK
ncbi:hypothetical protein BDN72DRAFT_897151 [Pluteus cervinus]|uniref:Uncharacterized protein n=1 Tax=Pluteus cervinus TaxID=181527 RepID=A0ACD3AWD2_9AGAR|nr:hypothetical protein BDN72DRAFT_897151 [Pluteus cervinus]